MALCAGRPVVFVHAFAPSAIRYSVAPSLANVAPSVTSSETARAGSFGANGLHADFAAVPHARAVHAVIGAPPIPRTAIRSVPRTRRPVKTSVPFAGGIDCLHAPATSAAAGVA